MKLPRLVREVAIRDRAWQPPRPEPEQPGPVARALYALLAAYCTAGALLGIAMLLAPWWPVRLWGGAVIAGAIVTAWAGRRVLL